ncbi:MAG TPA: hypothetical protein VL527_06325 [Dongiaceae bacterium]|jgi:hypothetical protein|nr:hypothetical protein [Dongiaceae bacterium]
MNDLNAQFGIDGGHVVLQMLLVLHLCLWVVALFRIARSIRGLAGLGWSILGFLVPLIGPVAAMMAARNHLNHAKAEVMPDIAHRS